MNTTRIMELKDLNNVSKLIVPLLEDSITLEDICKESGFVNAYTSDKNLPFLENKIFLLYDSSYNTIEALNRAIKFKSISTLYNRRYIKINKKHYTVYCFTTVNYFKTIKDLKNTGVTHDLKAIERICRFWNRVPSADIYSKLYNRSYLTSTPVFSELPEEDYYPPHL